MNVEPSRRPVSAILDEAVAGHRISAGDAHTLLLDGDLLDLGLAAHEVRNRWNDPEVATYNIDRNVNYTNVCVYKCRFCAFYREPGDPEGYLRPFEEIGQKVEPAGAATATARSRSSRASSTTRPIPAGPTGRTSSSPRRPRVRRSRSA